MRIIVSLLDQISTNSYLVINLSVVLNLRTTEKLVLQLSNSNLKETMRSPLQLVKKKIILGGKENVFR